MQLNDILSAGEVLAFGEVRNEATALRVTGVPT